MRIIIGITIGALLGSLLGHFGKCSTGACPLTSTPQNSIDGHVSGEVISAVIE